MPFTAINNSDIAVDKPWKQSIPQAIKDNFDYFNAQIGTFDTVDVKNGSFEIDADSDGIPDTWTRNLYSGGSMAIITAPTGGHGAKSVRFTQPSGASQGGGDLTSDYIPIYRNQAIPLGFQCGTSNGTIVAKVIIQCFTVAKAANGSDQTIYTSSGTESLDKFRIAWFIPNTGTFFIKIKLVGGEVGPNTSATVDFDNVTIRPHIRRLEMASATQAEVSTTATSFTTVGTGLIFGINQKIYNCDLLIKFVAEIKCSSPTADAWIRFTCGAATSNEVLSGGSSKYMTYPFMIQHTPAGNDALTVNMQLKATSGQTTFGQKIFGPIEVHAVDKSS